MSPPFHPSPFDRAFGALLARRGFSRRFLSEEGTTVHVFERAGGGDAPPLVFVHGVGTSAVTFTPLISRLTPHVTRITAIDLPGHGYSSPLPSQPRHETFEATVQGALERVSTPSSVLVGSSLGGFVAARFAARRPDAVGGVVLLSPGGALASNDDLDAVRKIFAIRSRRDADAFLARLYGRLPPPYLRPLIRAGIRRRFSDPSLAELLSLAAPEVMLSEGEIRAMRCPTLLIWGGRDRILPPAQFDVWTRALGPHAEIERWPDVGHIPHNERTGAVARRILRFVAERVTGRAA